MLRPLYATCFVPASCLQPTPPKLTQLQKGKPVMVATQMLSSMTTNARPTRAEVTDVGNAVLDGADAVMLCSETSTGDSPVQACQAMVSIVKRADEECNSNSLLRSAVPAHTSGSLRTHLDMQLAVDMNAQEICAASGVRSSVQLGANLIIVITRNGTTAKLVAKHVRSRP